MMNNNMDKLQHNVLDEDNPVFSHVPKVSLLGYVMDWLICNWKLVLFVSLVIIIGICLWCKYSPDQPEEASLHFLPSATHESSLDKVMIEGIYYGEYIGGDDEPLPVSVTRSSYGNEHYLLSARGQIYDFYLNRAEGTLESHVLGSGEISLIKIDSITTEIIIRFEGWIFKRLI